jgi:hypothetical protein
MTIDDIAISNRMSASEPFRSETTFELRPGADQRPLLLTVARACAPVGIGRNGPLDQDADGRKKSS